MKPVFIAVIIIAVLALGLGIYLYLPKAGTTNNPLTSSPSSTNPSSTPSQTSKNIEISGFAFNPSTLTVNVGDTVIWTNMDSISHTITSDSGNELSSSSFGNGQTYSHTFTTAGTFNYHCSIHVSMKGKVIVQ
jgi:plastocyanin